MRHAHGALRTLLIAASLLLPSLLNAAPCVREVGGNCDGGIGPIGPTGVSGPTGVTGSTGVPGPTGQAPLTFTTHVVQAGPHTCTGGDNDGTECTASADCTGGGTCTGTANATFRDEASGTVTTTVGQGDTVEWDYVTGIHDLLGGQVCAGGSNAGGACDPDSGNTNCHVCTGGSNDGHQCTSDGNCTGGGTCDLTGTCATTLAETWDGGTHAAPYTVTHEFLTPGTYPYICSLHASTGMKGVVVVTPRPAPPAGGEVALFHGVPKTVGYPHYLDGLPMSVVSQLGYADRGIGKRGIAVFTDDFLYGSNAKDDTFSSDAQLSDPRWKVQHDTGYSFPSYSTYPYFSGALSLTTYGGDTPATHKGIGVASWINQFHLVEGRQVWFTARVALAPESGSSLAPGLAAVGMVSFNQTTIHDYVNGAASVEGLTFYKAEGDVDWSLAVGECSGNPCTFTVLAANLVQAGLGTPPVAEQYIPLAFRVLQDATILVYVDGNVVAAVDPTQPQWAALRGYQTDQPSVRPAMNAELGDSHPVAIDNACQIGMRLSVDNILGAEETQSDAD